MKKLLCILVFGLANTFSLQASAQVNNVQGMGGSAASLNMGSDIESTLIAVQQNRANLLDEQFRGDLKNVQAKNAQIVALNTQLNVLKLAKLNPTDPKTIAMRDALILATPNPTDPQTIAMLDALKLAKLNPTDPQTIAKLDVQINKLRTQIDALSSTQQMDMLRLQSLSNKRNEAFDIMTNFMKKSADSRQGIIQNMR